MGTIYYLVDEARREALDLGKAYWMPKHRTGDVVTAALLQRPVGVDASYAGPGCSPTWARPLAIAWIEGRAGVMLLTDGNRLEPDYPWTKDLVLRGDWTCWDIHEPPSAGWHRWDDAEAARRSGTRRP